MKAKRTPKCPSLVRAGTNVNLNMQICLEVRLQLPENKRDMVEQHRGDIMSSRGTCGALDDRYLLMLEAVVLLNEVLGVLGEQKGQSVFMNV